MSIDSECNSSQWLAVVNNGTYLVYTWDIDSKTMTVTTENQVNVVIFVANCLIYVCLDSNNRVILLPHDAMHSMDYAVTRCLSVHRYSVKKAKCIINLLHHGAATPF